MNIETEIYALTSIEDDVIYLKYKDNIFVDLATIKLIEKQELELTNGKKFYHIVGMSDILGSMSDEGKKYSAQNKDGASLRYCDAVYTNSFIISLMLGIYLKIYKPIVPTKVFSNFEDAYNWVKVLKKTNNSAH